MGEEKTKNSDLQAQVENYNKLTDTKSLQLEVRMVEGPIPVVHGLLRVHWGVSRPIRLRSEDDSSNPSRWRHSCHCVTEEALQNQLPGASEQGDDVFKNRRSSMTDLITSSSRTGSRSESRGSVSDIIDELRPSNIPNTNDSLRRKKRLSVINGHTYHTDTNTFTPLRGSVTAVNITSLNTTDEVIQQLLSKFQVLNRMEEFCLCIKKKSGELHLLTSSDRPLLERIRYGPSELDTNIFIMDRDISQDISEEVATYMSLTNQSLNGLLKRVEEEESKMTDEIKTRYDRYKEITLKALEEKRVEG